MVQFVLTAIVSLLLVSGVSIVWPRFSQSPLPPGFVAGGVRDPLDPGGGALFDFLADAPSHPSLPGKDVSSHPH